MAREERTGSGSTPAVVGSENGHRMRQPQDDDVFGAGDGPTEASPLLGTAAGHGLSSRDEGPEAASGPQRKDSWIGMEEFEGLPWYQRPSVCVLPPPGPG